MTLTKLTTEVLAIDPERVCIQIEEFIRAKVKELNRDGAVIGLSGGVDSALVAYLLVRSLGARKVLALYMPEKESNPIHGEDARIIADELGIEFKIVNLTPILEARGVYNIFPVKYFRYLPTARMKGLAMRLATYFAEKITGKDLVAESYIGTNNKFVANSRAYLTAKHRQRLVTIYEYADRRNLLVAGAANRTEYLVGIFIKFGIDGLADIMPILPLYKTQVRQLARYVGVSEEIARKPADMDLMAGFDSKDREFGREDKLDLAVFGLENGLSPQEISDQLGFDIKKIERINVLMRSSDHMRRLCYYPQIAGLALEK